MKKNLSLLLLCLLLGSINAQNNRANQVPRQTKPIVTDNQLKTVDQTKKEKKISHWSIAVEGGLNKLDADVNQKYNDVIPVSFERVTFGGTLEYTLTPIWSMGLQYYYLPMHATGTYYAITNTTHSVDYFMAFNLVKLCFKNSKSKWGVWASIGGGMAFYSVDYKTNDNGKQVGINSKTGLFIIDENIKFNNGRALTIPVGGLVEYNFTKNFALGFKVQYRSFNKDNLDGRNFWGVTNDFAELGTLQLRWKFDAQNKNHTRNINLAQFENDIDPLEFAALKHKIDNTRRDLDSIKPKVEKHENFIKENAPIIATIPTIDKRVKKMEDIICPDGPDADNDGVPDCRDKEENTPLNTPVDFWGRSIKTYDNAAEIYFDFDKTDLDTEAHKAIRIAAEKMMADPALLVEVRGFTDNMGNVPYNENLSQRRAEKVKNELVRSYNIDANRIIANGKGKYNPQDKVVPYRLYRTAMFFYNK